MHTGGLVRFSEPRPIATNTVFQHEQTTDTSTVPQDDSNIKSRERPQCAIEIITHEHLQHDAYVVLAQLATSIQR